MSSCLIRGGITDFEEGSLFKFNSLIDRGPIYSFSMSRSIFFPSDFRFPLSFPSRYHLEKLILEQRRDSVSKLSFFRGINLDFFLCSTFSSYSLSSNSLDARGPTTCLLPYFSSKLTSSRGSSAFRFYFVKS